MSTKSELLTLIGRFRTSAASALIARTPPVSRSNIWAFKQNKPSQIVADLAPWVEASRVYTVLLQRGVFKWMAVRRDLIRLKEQWKERGKIADIADKAARRQRNGYDAAYLKGYRQALLECRMEVRALCHSDRWRAPDNDREAQRWLDDYHEHEKVEGK